MMTTEEMLTTEDGLTTEQMLAEFVSRFEFAQDVHDLRNADVERAGGIAANGVSVLFHRCRQNPKHFEAVSLRTFMRFSKGLGVSLPWLMFGIGNMTDKTVTQPTRELVELIDLVGKERWNAEILALVADLPIGYEPTAKQWVRILDLAGAFLQAISSP